VPRELSEAARIDGCSELGILHENHSAAVQTRPRDRCPLQLHLDVERFPRPARLPA
jgi:hypothetical protein